MYQVAGKEKLVNEVGDTDSPAIRTHGLAPPNHSWLRNVLVITDDREAADPCERV
jgi:hypothetical protein